MDVGNEIEGKWKLNVEVGREKENTDSVVGVDVNDEG